MTEIIKSLRNVLSILEDMDQKKGAFKEFKGFHGYNKAYYKDDISEAYKKISNRLRCHEMKNLFKFSNQELETERKKQASEHERIKRIN